MTAVELSKQAAAGPLRLTPLMNKLVSDFLADERLVFDLLEGLGSPLNVLFPAAMSANIAHFRETFSRNDLIGRVFFAHKCNQSDSLTRQLSAESCGIDVSSVRELQHALSSGFTADRIEVTGPKSVELLALSIQHGVWINVDSLPELRQLICLGEEVKNHPPVKILLRLSGFRSEHSRFLNKGSRFGIPLPELEEALSVLEQAADIQLEGFSFHLDTVSVLERTVAVENCLDAFENAVNRGFSPHILDIGGGYKVNYLAHADEWNRYTSALKESVLGTVAPLTWHGNAFGLHGEKGVLKGNFNSYNYYDGQTGGDFLDELISQKLPNMGNATVASVLRDNMIELWIEPGRALVDQCGVTLARVETVRSSSNEEVLVNLAMKRQDVSFLDQEIFVDPVVLKRQNLKTADSPPELATAKCEAAVFFAGNLCLESDLIYRHKTFLEALPSAGDAVAFVNTAGYFMDFSASQSIMQPLARKVAVTDDGERLRWCLDDCYWPYGKR